MPFLCFAPEFGRVVCLVGDFGGLKNTNFAEFHLLTRASGIRFYLPCFFFFFLSKNTCLEKLKVLVMEGKSMMTEVLTGWWTL